jgi:hypothetical protein
VTAVLFLVVVVLPPLLADGEDSNNEVRTTLLQALAGLVLLGGLYLTYRTFDLNRQGHELDRQGQFTERFTRAIQQLGSDREDVRLGGIYALERVAQDSEKEYGPVMEVLTAFIRVHAPWPPSAATQTSSPKTAKVRPSADVQSALKVIGRRNYTRDDKDFQIRLSDVDLRGASLRGGHFENSRLRRTHLEDAKLEGAHLQGARLREANLSEADLGPSPELELLGAHLEGAHLYGANFERAKLKGAHLRGAFYDARTTWPVGFSPDQEGLTLATPTATE